MRENGRESVNKEHSRLETLLKPCINTIYGSTHRLTLHGIVLWWKIHGEGASQYVLYHRGYVNSKNGLNRALETLEECRYVVSKRVEASTHSPKKKILYYPTPEGVYLHGILALLYPQDLQSLKEKAGSIIFSDTEAAYTVTTKLLAMGFLLPHYFGLMPPAFQEEGDLKRVLNFYTLLYAWQLLIVKSLTKFAREIYPLIQTASEHEKKVLREKFDEGGKRVLEFMYNLPELIDKARRHLHNRNTGHE